MDPETCRQRVGCLMGEETDALQQLAVLLEHEYACLAAEDVVALEGAAHARQRCVARICRGEEERRILCRDLNYAADLQGLEALLRWCDPQATLAGKWAGCARAATHCRSLNDRNAALVGARLKQVEARLGVLIEGRRDSTTYGPRGACGQTPAGRVVATEA